MITLAVLSLASAAWAQAPAKKPATTPAVPTVKRQRSAPPLVPRPAATLPFQKTRPPEGGYGFNIGEPTGLVAKVPIAELWRVAVGIGYSFRKKIEFSMDFLTYLDSSKPVGPTQSTVLWKYIGVGPVLLLATDEKVKSVTGEIEDPAVSGGVRVPMGLEWHFLDRNLGLVLELDPGYELAPKRRLLLNGIFGIRFYGWGEMK